MNSPRVFSENAAFFGISRLFELHRAGAAARIITLLCLFGSLLTVPAQTSVTFAWNTNPGSGIVGYRLYQGIASRVYTNSINAGIATGITVSGLARGATYFFAVTAYDARGIESDLSDEISYTVPSTNPVPSIALTSPSDGQSYALPATISLAATVTANGHTITKVQFYDDTVLLGESASPLYNFNWINMSSGNHSVTARAVYDAGSTVTSTAAKISVLAARPPPGPLLRIRVTPSREVQLSGSGQPGHTYDVLATQDFINWTIAGTTTVDGSGSLQFTDPTPAILSSCSYRLQEVLAPPSFQVALTTDWQVLITGKGPIAHTYDIQATDDSINWTLIGTVTIDGTGSFQFVDWSGLFFYPTRSYRLRESPVAPTLQITVWPDQEILLTGTGPAGRSYWVQATEDFATWTPIGMVSVDYTGSFAFIDGTGPNYASRFYRLQLYVP